MSVEITSIGDLVARLGLVGIFVIENIFHARFLQIEVETLVQPALQLSRPACVVFHSTLITLGFFSSVSVLLASIAGSGRLLRLACRGMLVFLACVTFIWWFRRSGIWFWEAEDQKARQIQLMKNCSIAGGISILSSLSGADFKEPLISTFRRLFLSTRPWSLPASIIPVLVVSSSFESPISTPVSLIYFTLGVASLQAATNLFNSYTDFNRKIDRPDTAGDRTIVDGFLTPNGAFYFGVLLTLVWAGLFASVEAVSWGSFLRLSSLGLALALSYSLGAAPLKYLGLGDVAVFLAFGPVLASATSAAAGMEWSATVRACAFSAPVSLLVVAILHANNIRDIMVDSNNGAKTVAVRLGKKASLRYFDFLIFSPFIGVAVLAQVYKQPGLALALIALPQVLELRNLLRGEPVERTVDALTARAMVSFGVSQVVGMLAYNAFFP